MYSPKIKAKQQNPTPTLVGSALQRDQQNKTVCAEDSARATYIPHDLISELALDLNSLKPNALAKSRSTPFNFVSSKGS